MFQLFSTPIWFHVWDVLFDVVGLVAALLIAAYSWKIYRLHDENKFAYFSLAFLLVAVGLVAKFFTSSVLYFFPVRDTVAQLVVPALGSLDYSHLLYRLAFLIQMILMLGAWLLIFFISQKSRERLKKFYEVAQMALFVYFVVLISVVSNFQYFVFYLTSSVILGLIVLNYYKNYLNTGCNSNAFKVMLSFLFMLLGNLVLVFVFLFPQIYVIGEALILLGFLLLLYTYITIIGRK